MKKKLTIYVNLFVGIMSYAAWLLMAIFTKNQGALSSNSISSLKYFTVLSNLFNGTVCLIYVYYLAKNKIITPRKRATKLAATSAVGLTFFTVIVFLGPLYGYKLMFSGSNFWMHLILPILSFISFIFLEEGEMPFKYTLYSIIAPFIYSIGYVLNIIINGIGEWPNKNDFYSFLSWGNFIGFIISMIILLITYVISIVLYRLNKVVLRKEGK